MDALRGRRARRRARAPEARGRQRVLRRADARALASVRPTAIGSGIPRSVRGRRGRPRPRAGCIPRSRRRTPPRPSAASRGMRTLARPDDLADVLRRLQSVNAASVARWGRMSAHQMICHLGDALRVATGEKVVTPRTGPAKRTVVKWIALYFPARWPAGIATPAEIDQY